MAAARMKGRARDAYEHVWKRIEPKLGHLDVEQVDTVPRGDDSRRWRVVGVFSLDFADAVGFGRSSQR